MHTNAGTVLDPQETMGSLGVWPLQPGEPPPEFVLPRHGTLAETPSHTFRHSGWAGDRQRVLEALKETRQRQQRITSFCDCGDDAYILKSTDDPPRYKVVGSTCHDRFCLPCATERARTIAVNAIELIGNTRVRFITLTLRQSAIGLTATLDHLLESFKKLRKTTLWKTSVTGGVGFVELKLNPDTRFWNVHIHLLCTGKYILRDSLSEEWLKCTGDSFVVHIMLPKGHQHVVKYITKYASKPLNSSFSHDPEALQEAVTALKGRRLCTTFGGWRGLLNSERSDTDGWESIGTLATWLQRSLEGELEAIEVVSQVSQSRWDHVQQNHPTNPHPPPPHPPSLTFKQLTFQGIDTRRRLKK